MLENAIGDQGGGRGAYARSAAHHRAALDVFTDGEYRRIVEKNLAIAERKLAAAKWDERMTSIFISYKRENQDAVQRIVQGLRGAGLDVWWDQDIAPDAPWEQTIESELEKAKVVIVCWSEAAIASENVKAEARRARTQGKLIQTYVEPCEPPLFFGERQGVDLSSWNGNPSDNRFQAIITAARAILTGKKPPDGVGYRPRERTPWAALTALFVLLSAVFGFISNLGGARSAVCELAALNPYCVQYGLINVAETVDPAVVQAQARERLMQSLNGMWGRLDRDCTNSVMFAVALGDDGLYRIRSTANGGFDSTMQVTTIDTENGVVTARQSMPGEGGRREQWEYRPDGDMLAMRDSAGTETALARCGAPAIDAATMLRCARDGTWGIAQCPSVEEVVNQFSEAGEIATLGAPETAALGQPFVVRAAAGLIDRSPLTNEAEHSPTQERPASAILERHAELGEAPSIQSTSVNMLRLQQAELIGTGVTIEPLFSQNRQACLRSRPCEWAWRVTPTELGDQVLTLTVSGVFEFAEERIPPIVLRTTSHRLRVDVSSLSAAPVALNVINNYWAMLAGIVTAIFAVAAFLLGIRRRARGR